MSFELVVTRGGARAVLDHDTGEVMHPVVGPRVEADAVYVAPARLAERLASGGPPLVVFDVGLGAGSNAAAAWRASEARTDGRRLDIVSFDRTTGALELALGCADDFGLDAGAARAVLDTGAATGRLTRWTLIRGELPAILAGAGRADVVFWDPFSPRANPELWTVAAFTALRAACNPGATVHTYSAATSVRAALLLAGFAVGFGAATGTVPHTTAAAVDAVDLAAPLDHRWLERLARSSAPLPADAGAGALDRIRAHPQFR